MLSEFSIEVLINSGSNNDAMQSSFKKKLDLCICKINVNTQKINSSRLQIYGIVLGLFWVDKKDGKPHFFEETFLLADISIDIAFKISFFTLNNIVVNFNNQELKWSLYITAKALFTIKQIEMVGRKEFVVIVLNLENDIFVVYILSLTISDMSKIHPFCRAQIASLQVEGTLTTVFPEYLNFLYVFSLKLVAEFLEYTKINNHVINLFDDKKLLYKPIYSLESMKLETLNIYIKTNLVNNFIRSSKLSLSAQIFLVPKRDGIFCLCINYSDLSNLTIKNWHLLPLIDNSLD